MSDIDASKLLARVPIAIRWRDLDAFDHVNNATFLTYLEEARLHWLTGIEGIWRDASMQPVLAATNLNFRQPIQWPGEVIVELRVERLGARSLTIGHRILGADAGTLHGDGNAVIVWTDPANGRSIALPEAVRAACG